MNKKEGRKTSNIKYTREKDEVKWKIGWWAQEIDKTWKMRKGEGKEENEKSKKRWRRARDKEKYFRK